MQALTRIDEMAPLADLLAGIEYRILTGPLPRVSMVEHDSRAVKPGALFVCIPGGKHDGHRYIADAIRGGAIALMGSDKTALREAGAPAVLVDDPRAAMGIPAHRALGNPTRALNLVGVTGTNGKTTIVHLLGRLLRSGGARTGRIGTLGAMIDEEMIPLHNTTPESADLAALFRRMVDAGVTRAAMEVSSHGLALGRTLGCEFDVAVFTNLTQDHLDFHCDFENYFAAKTLLFTEYPERSDKAFSAAINIGDPFGARLAAISKGAVVTYGAADADIVAERVQMGGTGSSFRLPTPYGTIDIATRLVGAYNVSNVIAAVTAALAAGMPIDDIATAMAEADAPPGRLERVNAGQPFNVIVDYAHTPDALANALRAMRAITPGRLLVVFGCGGDRDRTKRPQMGRAAQDLADICFVTSDNPRSEDPAAIVDEILTGMDISHTDVLHVIVDRAEAIHAAIREAEANDTVLIAGKGHEDYQILKNETIHFDDREVAREVLAAWTA